MNVATAGNNNNTINRNNKNLKRKSNDINSIVIDLLSDTDNDSDCDEDVKDEDKSETKERKENILSKFKLMQSIKRTKRQKFNHVPDEYCVYMLRLMKPGSKFVYIGSTQNFSKRIAQHNCIISGNSKKCKTRKYSCNGEFKWEPICVISSPELTKELSLQLEYKLQHFGKFINSEKLKEECFNNNPNLVFLDPASMIDEHENKVKVKVKVKARARNWPINEHGLKLEDRIKHLIFCLNLNKWTVKSTVKADSINMKLTWYRPHEQPKDSDIINYFPPNILQVEGNMSVDFDYCNF